MGTRYNAPDAAGVIHYVTRNVRDRQPAFRRDEYARLCLDEARFECDRHPARLLAYVVMPDHLHFLLYLEDGRLTRFLARFKPAVTKKMDTLALELNHQRRHECLKNKGSRELWQDGKHSVHLWSRRLVLQKARYIHDNPVRAGLVSSPAEYPWSSYVAFEGESSGQEPPVPIDPLPEM